MINWNLSYPDSIFLIISAIAAIAALILIKNSSKYKLKIEYVRYWQSGAISNIKTYSLEIELLNLCSNEIYIYPQSFYFKNHGTRKWHQMNPMLYRQNDPIEIAKGKPLKVRFDEERQRFLNINKIKIKDTLKHQWKMNQRNLKKMINDIESIQ